MEKIIDLSKYTDEQKLIGLYEIINHLKDRGYKVGNIRDIFEKNKALPLYSLIIEENEN